MNYATGIDIIYRFISYVRPIIIDFKAVLGLKSENYRVILF